MTRTELEKLWETRKKEFKESGLSVAAWAKNNNINPGQAYYWLGKETKKPSPKTEITWLPLEINKNNKSPQPLRVQIGQATIEIKSDFEPQLLLDIVNTLLIAQ